MRVVSLVPSWTETLILAGVDVVGRTRFCIHPRERVSAIPRVGGTKDWSFERILSLKPDLLILDREENPKFMSEQKEVPWIATHVESVNNVAAEIERLNAKLPESGLSEFAKRWQRVASAPRKVLDIERPPALLEWGRKPEGGIRQVLYVIWRNPWMAVGQGTFIVSALDLFGWAPLIPAGLSKYGEVDLSSFERKSTLLLFSSEPFPFLKKRQDLQALGFPFAFVDGESLSWFGARSLAFLEREFGPEELAKT